MILPPYKFRVATDMFDVIELRISSDTLTKQNKNPLTRHALFLKIYFNTCILPVSDLMLKFVWLCRNCDRYCYLFFTFFFINWYLFSEKKKNIFLSSLTYQIYYYSLNKMISVDHTRHIHLIGIEKNIIKWLIFLFIKKNQIHTIRNETNWEQEKIMQDNE